MNKKGMVLRDVLFMILIGSAIIVFASVFVSEMGFTYDNTAMQNEFSGSNFSKQGESTFYQTQEDTETISNETEINLGGVLCTTLLGDTACDGLRTAKTVIGKIILAPNTFGNMISSSLQDINVPKGIANPIGITIKIALYGLIVFTIISAFLKGGKL